MSLYVLLSALETLFDFVVQLLLCASSMCTSRGAKNKNTILAKFLENHALHHLMLYVLVVFLQLIAVFSLLAIIFCYEFVF